MLPGHLTSHTPGEDWLSQSSGGTDTALLSSLGLPGKELVPSLPCEHLPELSGAGGTAGVQVLCIQALGLRDSLGPYCAVSQRGLI